MQESQFGERMNRGKGCLSYNNSMENLTNFNVVGGKIVFNGEELPIKRKKFEIVDKSKKVVGMPIPRWKNGSLLTKDQRSEEEYQTAMQIA